MCIQSTFGFIGQKAVDLGDGAVESDDIKAVVGRVEDQILAHDGQSNETKVSAIKARESVHASHCTSQRITSRTYVGWACSAMVMEAFVSFNFW